LTYIRFPTDILQFSMNIKRIQSFDLFPVTINDKLYSSQMVVTANTTKYTIENDLTKKEKKTKQKYKQTHRQMACTCLKKTN